jgi:hypothetical protein
VAGRVPDELAEQFAADTLELKTHELSEKYNIAQSAVKDWRLDCKRRLAGIDLGRYAPGALFSTVLNERGVTLKAKASTSRSQETLRFVGATDSG